MFDFKVKIDVADALAALNALDAKALEDKIANAVADEVVLPKLVKAPSPSGKKMQFVSARQRAFVMASIRSGAISVPYHRSGRLSGGWQKQAIGGGLALTNSVSYAPYVVGDGGDQAAYHKGNWDTVDQVATDSEEMASAAATAAVVDLIGSAA